MLFFLFVDYKWTKLFQMTFYGLKMKIYTQTRTGEWWDILSESFFVWIFHFVMFCVVLLCFGEIQQHTLTGLLIYGNIIFRNFRDNIMKTGRKMWKICKWKIDIDLIHVNMWKGFLCLRLFVHWNGIFVILEQIFQHF